MDHFQKRTKNDVFTKENHEKIDFSKTTLKGSLCSKTVIYRNNTEIEEGPVFL